MPSTPAAPACSSRTSRSPSGNLASKPWFHPNDLVLDVTFDPTHSALAPASELPADKIAREVDKMMDQEEDDDEY